MQAVFRVPRYSLVRTAPPLSRRRLFRFFVSEIARVRSHLKHAPETVLVSVLRCTSKKSNSAIILNSIFGMIAAHGCFHGRLFASETASMRASALLTFCTSSSVLFQREADGKSLAGSTKPPVNWNFLSKDVALIMMLSITSGRCPTEALIVVPIAARCHQLPPRVRHVIKGLSSQTISDNSSPAAASGCFLR